ncbi:serine/threonine protein kinase [Streptomyces bambusae]|uniref:serine/threonine-protein kinase n=1 Tax=Streptomyces bambusae TaxID=1550616 RepID=UPI001CFED47C|nr:serine/threonine-protein kinase [Streptomyces bambusae]MCB5165783.1 serine/threonine protein kinase [Streptomyces bambusae]
MSQGAPRNSTVIGGRYRLEQPLGRGGMGTVWRATDELLGRRVAVKELHVEGGASAAGALREARVVARLRHPHVVVVHDVVEHDGHPYIVMELVDGGSLAHRLATRGPLDPGEAARVGLALLGALTAAHAGGVLHRDVKPANVLLEAGSGRVVLTDFGIARLAGATTISESRAFVGSPEYTAPERMQGGEAGPASDLWSLGALLCAAVSGESPFRRDSLGGILHAVVFDVIRPPQELGPLLPAVRGLLERDPEQRLTAAGAERLLTECAESAGPGGRPVVHTPTEAVPAAASGAPTEARPVAVDPGAGDGPASDGTTQRDAQRPGRRMRLGLIAALVACTALGAAGAAALLNGDDGRGAGAAGPGATRAAGAAPGRTAPPGASAPTPGAVPPSARAVPPGYRFVPDAAGFGLAVPEGYQRATDDQRVFYLSPDTAIRIGVKVRMPVPGGPLEVMQAAHRDGPDTNRGYRGGQVVATTHNGMPAARWEFSWNGFSAAEGPRHTVDVCWEENSRLYDLWVSAPVGRVDEATRHFDAALDSFVATVGSR